VRPILRYEGRGLCGGRPCQYRQEEGGRRKNHSRPKAGDRIRVGIALRQIDQERTRFYDRFLRCDLQSRLKMRGWLSQPLFLPSVL